MILSKRMSVNIVDLYFDEPVPSGINSDIIRYNQWSKPVAGASFVSSCSTIILDLTQSQEELWSNLKKHTRQKIRRAEKDDLVYEFSNDGRIDMVTKFADHVDRYGGLKNLVRVSRPRLFILARSGTLDVSFVYDTRGEIMAASSYLITAGRARGLYAASAFRGTADPTRRTAIGRANRYLYWQDILRLKQAGVPIVDFGGYYTGSDDQEKLRINAFKDEFGGRVLHEYNCRQAATRKGVAALWAIEMIHRWQARRPAATRYPSKGQAIHEGSVPASL
jgi:hypothetical protein